MKRLLTLLPILLLFSSCDDIVEDAIDNAFDCIDNDGPAFLTSKLENATVQSDYSEYIETKIEREPNDDRFFYHFSITKGDLPQGLFFKNDDFGRFLNIRGVPNEAGTFKFTVEVRVSEYLNSDFYDDDDSTLCRTTETREFTITIDP